MNQFDDLRNWIDDVGELTKLTESEIAELESKGYPGDYIEFLSSIGYGDVNALKIYSGPIEPGFVYPESSGLEEIMLFADDYQGFCYGFDRKHGMKVVTVDPRGRVEEADPDPEADPRDFGAFIRVFVQPAQEDA